MIQSTLKCKACGACCYYEIPLTILDIHRLANHLNRGDRETFERYIQPRLSQKSGLFMIAKKPDHSCVFLDENHQCSVHAFKPRTCEFFFCQNQELEAEMPWTALCTGSEQKQKLWEQSVASQVTRKYIERNGTEWHEQDFNKSLLSIYDNIVTSHQEKLKLARIGNNQPVGLVYNCQQCQKTGTCARETIVTIPDMERIIKHLNLSWQQLFDWKLDKHISEVAGTFKLYRETHCIFFNADQQCSIEPIKPMHCRFTPCPKKVKDEQLYDAFYLGAGSIEEQFQHQVALAVTNEYTQTYGNRCKPEQFEEKLEKYRYYVSKRTGFQEFCKRIANYRYVDDTLIYRKQGKKHMH